MQAKGVAPNTIAYNCAIRACGTAELWPAALSLLDDMRVDGVRPSIITINAALLACERGQQWEEAALLVREVEAPADEADSASLVPDSVTFHTAIACARDGGTQGSAAFAREMLRAMASRGLAPSVIGYTGVLRACNTAGRFADALHVFEQLERGPTALDAVAVNEALAACAGTGRWEEALRLLALLAEPARAGFSATR